MTGKIILIGNVNIDLVMGPVAEWPTVGTETVLPHSDWRVGGASGNTALALDAISGRYQLIANRSDDDFGKWLAKAFIPHSDKWNLAAGSAGLSVGITHPDGERTFFTSLGHLNAFSYEDVISQLPSAGDRDIALLSGAFVTPKLLPNYGKLIRELKRRGFSVALDTGWPTDGWTVEMKETVQSWCAHCDHVLINESEMSGLAGMMNVPLEAAMQFLSKKMPSKSSLVVKCGPDGAFALYDGCLIKSESPLVNVIDTIGAGDIFNAGYLSALIRNSSLVDALNAAVGMASLAISTHPRRYLKKLTHELVAS
jgi:sugar/nucleoside kinase (ribokinase family)